MDDAARRRARLRRLALLCAALVLAITSLSAYIRLKHVGLGCADWPACYGQRLRDAQAGRGADGAAEPGGIAAARAAHRVAAVAALFVVLALLATAARRPRLPLETLLALALLALSIGLAVLGRWSAGARVPAVAVGNVVGGLAMFALAWRLAWPPPAGPPAPGQRCWARGAAVLLVAQVALGTLVSASYAGLACTSTVDCLRGAAVTGWPWEALDAWREPRFDAPGAAVVVNATGATAQLVHRAGALAVAVALLPLMLALWSRGPRRAAPVLLGLLGLQWALGALLATAGLPLAAAVAHNVAAALLLGAVVRWI